MKIKSLYFKNSFLGWEVEYIHFDQLNLLVGLSGSGKSQILNALWHIRGIALGKQMNGVSWKIKFSNDGKEFEWEGEFTNQNRRGRGESDSYKIKTEVLQTTDGRQSIIRKADGSIEIKDPKAFPERENISGRLAGDGLIFQLYAGENQFIKQARQGFNKMVFRDHTLSQSDTNADFYRLSFRYNAAQYRDITIEKLKQSGFNTAERLLLAVKRDLKEYHDIVEQFKVIFPEVNEVKIEEYKNIGQTTGHIEYQIRAGNSQKWIPHWNISSGMLRILNYLAEVHLANEETVFLVDEFENSLGHNCLPPLAEDIVNQTISHQFIITSHHPDIINYFPMSNWIVVKRSNGKIQNHRTNELPLEPSYHEAYSILMNHFDSNSPKI